MTQRSAPRGSTLIELVLGVMLLGLAAGIAMPRPDPTAFALRSVENTFIADLRRTRAEAMTRGVHFSLEIVDPVTYRILRLREESEGVWVQDGQPIVVRVALESVRVGTANVGTVFEFNTRGVLVVPTSTVTVSLYQDVTGLRRDVDVWPSGQVTRPGAVS